MYSFQGQSDELAMQHLIKDLEKEYRKTDCYRKDKVANLKRLIKQGLYHVPGKALVEKWFPEPPASESR